VGACGGAAAAAGGGGEYILGHRRPSGLTATAHLTSLTTSLFPSSALGQEKSDFRARSGGGGKSVLVDASSGWCACRSASLFWWRGVVECCCGYSQATAVCGVSRLGFVVAGDGNGGGVASRSRAAWGTRSRVCIRELSVLDLVLGVHVHHQSRTDGRPCPVCIAARERWLVSSRNNCEISVFSKLKFVFPPIGNKCRQFCTSLI
jgi:hypothetical protein